VSKDHGSKDHGHHGHHDEHGSHRQYEEAKAKKRGLHKDWRAWTVVLLMVALIFAYLATLDEARSPVREPNANPNSAPMPADAPVAP
jgi:hypothetical protein